LMDFSPFIEVARRSSSTDPAHDFLHVERVLENAKLILKDIPADSEVIIPAILLHELFNYPKNDPRSQFSGDICAELAGEILDKHQYPMKKRGMVLDCIRFHSFSRGVIPAHIEGKIVQDADRLDAVGAIGIARLFATSGKTERPFYDLGDPFGEHRIFDDKTYGVDHFYVKLLKLAEGMHTTVAKEMALSRTTFMLKYIEQLRSEIQPTILDLDS
jgi:uncharacterized protein